MKDFDIWQGYYNIDGSSPSEPEHLATVLALDFRSACMKYELATKLDCINYQERQGYVDDQTYEWFYNYKTMTNTWSGKYYQTKAEAFGTFKKITKKLITKEEYDKNK